VDGLGLVCARRRTRRFYTAKPYNEGAKGSAGLKSPATGSAVDTMGGAAAAASGRDCYAELRLVKN
jgi:hypothetical protein